MKRKIPIFIGFCCLLAATVDRVSSQPKVSDKNTVGDNISFNSISKAEIELLLADVAKTNPMIIERLANDPEVKKQQIENLRQLLAFASQAQREGLASDAVNKQEMDNIRAEVLAVNYDREINKDRSAMPPFGFITDEAVNAFWSEKEVYEAEFKDFLNTKITLLRASNPEMLRREISDDEKKQARDIFAKTRIYKAEFDLKDSLIDEFLCQHS